MRQTSKGRKNKTRATSALGCDKARKDSMYKRACVRACGRAVGWGNVSSKSSNRGDLIVSDAYTFS